MDTEQPQQQQEPYTGCSHYRRKCQLEAPCCGGFWPCRFCHDAEKEEDEKDWKKAHKLDRHKVSRVKCMACGLVQRSQQTCEGCGTVMGAYFCGICNLFDDQDRGQWHCEGCGICRVGVKNNFFHCDTCQTCLGVGLKGSHKCVQQHSTVCLKASGGFSYLELR